MTSDMQARVGEVITLVLPISIGILSYNGLILLDDETFIYSRYPVTFRVDSTSASIYLE